MIWTQFFICGITIKEYSDLEYSPAIWTPFFSQYSVTSERWTNEWELELKLLLLWMCMEFLFHEAFKELMKTHLFVSSLDM